MAERSQCPGDAIRLRAAEERLGPAEEATWGPHIQDCTECSAAIAEFRALAGSLVALGDAERQAIPAFAWTRFEARARRPSFAERLPLGVAGLARQSADLLHPAVAGTALATLSGLALGTWLALSTSHSPSTALATQPYDVSNLLEDSSGSLAASYFDDGAVAASAPFDASGATAGIESGGQPDATGGAAPKTTTGSTHGVTGGRAPGTPTVERESTLDGGTQKRQSAGRDHREGATP